MMGIRLAWIALFMLGLAGCGSMKGYGVSRWPVYQTPPAPGLTAEDEALLKDFEAQHPKTFKKIHGQFLAYREIVRIHNKGALEINRRQLQALGYESQELDRMLPPGGVE